jgi:nicotinate-nucleotide adenylyltransferase
MPPAIGILGGTFDPVHNGHVILAIEAVERLKLDRLIVIPAHQSPHKRDREAAPADVRLRLLKLAFVGVPSIEVDDLELRRAAPSFTVDTIAELQRRHRDGDFVLLLGNDALAEFPRWREAERVGRACRVAVFRRGHAEEVVASVRKAMPGLRLEILETPLIGISSTQVRERASQGRSLRGYVPDAVREEIERQGLYRAG